MQYNDILKKIEQDTQNDNRTDLYRYNGLLEAIRFFSNRLTFDQITDAAFDFVNELLTVDKSVMYLLKNNGFELIKQRGVKSSYKRIEMTKELSEFALYVGNVINSKMLCCNILKRFAGRAGINKLCCRFCLKISSMASSFFQENNRVFQ